MNHPPVGGGEGTAEAERFQLCNLRPEARSHRRPVATEAAAHRRATDRIEAEPHVDRAWRQLAGFEQSGKMIADVAALRADLKFDGDVGFEMDAVERPRQRLPGRRQAEPICGIAAGKHQRQPAGAAREILQRLLVRDGRVGVIDPLHDLPRRRQRAADHRRALLCARIDRVDGQSVGGLADQLFERSALEHPIDELTPVIVGRRCEISRQFQIVGGRGHSAACSLKAYCPVWH